MKYKILTIQQSFLKLEWQTKDHQFIIFNHLLSIQFIESQWKCFISSFIIETSVLTFTKLFKSKQNLWILDQSFLKYIPRKLCNEFCIQIQTTFARKTHDRCYCQPLLTFLSPFTQLWLPHISWWRRWWGRSYLWQLLPIQRWQLRLIRDRCRLDNRRTFILRWWQLGTRIRRTRRGWSFLFLHYCPKFLYWLVKCP